MEEKFHCYECAGTGKARGYDCLTCDGEGNPKPVIKPVVEKPKEEPKKKAKK